MQDGKEVYFWEEGDIHLDMLQFLRRILGIHRPHVSSGPGAMFLRRFILGFISGVLLGVVSS